MGDSEPLLQLVLQRAANGVAVRARLDEHVRGKSERHPRQQASRFRRPLGTPAEPRLAL
jgi:hypothetical protein